MEAYELGKDIVELQQSITRLEYKIDLLMQAAGIIKKEETTTKKEKE